MCHHHQIDITILLSQMAYQVSTMAEKTYTYPNGLEDIGGLISSMVNEWEDDKQHDQGTLTYPDDSQYVG